MFRFGNIYHVLDIRHHDEYLEATVPLRKQSLQLYSGALTTLSLKS